MPWQQSSPGLQALAQEPHADRLVERLKQAKGLSELPVAQHVSPAPHRVVQSPQYPVEPSMSRQTWPLQHRWVFSSQDASQAPQLLTSAVMSVQIPWQQRSSGLPQSLSFPQAFPTRNTGRLTKTR
jgi:hypothetical protein